MLISNSELYSNHFKTVLRYNWVKFSFSQEMPSILLTSSFSIPKFEMSVYTTGYIHRFFLLAISLTNSAPTIQKCILNNIGSFCYPELQEFHYIKGTYNKYYFYTFNFTGLNNEFSKMISDRLK